MDEYYKKIKSYKMVQNGGYGWNDYVKEKQDAAEKISSTNEIITKFIAENKVKLDEIGVNATKIKEDVNETSKALEDSLKVVKELADGINLGTLSASVLKPIQDEIDKLKLEGIDITKPEDIWNKIVGQAPPLPPRPPAEQPSTSQAPAPVEQPPQEKPAEQPPVEQPKP